MERLTVLPLHPGRAPRWLFGRMVRLGGLISNAVIDEYGTDELVSRLANPYWLQALSNAIGYDWHSSGSTTVTMGALKEALNYSSDVFIAGGKGKVGTDTPNQIPKGADYLSIGSMSDSFIEKSRLAAKIDSALVFDDIGIYHHTFVMSKKGSWCVVQQAMDNRTRSAIRFQIDSKGIGNDMANETNSCVAAAFSRSSLDLTYSKNREAREASVIAVNEGMKEVKKIAANPYVLPRRHEILPCDLGKRDVKLLDRLDGIEARDYEDILKTKGVGRKTVRSLAFIASLIYDRETYERNPVLYSYNLGGKDGIPYPVNLGEYDRVIESMKEIVEGTGMEKGERYHVLKRLDAITANA